MADIQKPNIVPRFLMDITRIPSLDQTQVLDVIPVLISAVLMAVAKRANQVVA